MLRQNKAHFVSGGKRTMDTIDSSHMRALNSSTVLKMIWQNEEISRADISRMTGMSRSTISAIVARLIEKRLIGEGESRLSKGGRRPVNLAFEARSYTLMGIDISGSDLTFLSCDLRGRILETKTVACDVLHCPKEAVELIKNAIATCEKASAPHSPVLGIGIGVPVPVHPNQKPTSLLATIAEAWADVSLSQELAAVTRTPIYFENNANLGALAELWWNSQDGQKRNLAFVTLGAKVGAGLIIDGKIHRGSRGLTGEIGDVILNVDQTKGYTEKGSFKTIQNWIDAVISKDGSIDAHFEEGAYFLGVGLTNLLALLDLDEVVFGGSIRQPGDVLVRKLNDVVQSHGLQGRDVKLSWSRMGTTQIALGGATMVLEKLLEDSGLVP